MSNTFSATNSLKGIAISAVLINHYLNMNVKGTFLGYASLFVSLFFIVSGYGIYHSLTNRYRLEPHGIKKLLTFYANRLLRLYPLFLVAYITQCILFDTPILTWTLLGIHAQGHFWFIPAIIQCYLVSPLFFICLKKNRFWSLNGLILTFLIANVLLTSGALPELLGNSLRFIHQYWREVYFLSPLLFGLAMLVAEYIECWNEVASFEKIYLFALLLALVLFMMIIFNYQQKPHYLFSLLTTTICPLLLLTISAIYFLANNLSISLLSSIGTASFSIYLFHIIFYRSVNQLTGLGKNSWLEFIIVLILLPLFFYLCKFVEKQTSMLLDRLKHH